MNWSKTKTILILALLFTNLVLVAYLASEGRLQEQGDRRDQEAFPLVVQELQSQKIHLSFDSPPGIDRVHGVEASFEVFDCGKLAKRFWGDGYEQKGTKAQKNGETLEVVDKTLMIYDNPASVSASHPDSPETARKQAEAFLAEKGFDADSEMEWRMSGDGFASEILIRQTVNRRFVDNSYMLFKVSSKGIYHFERKWFKIDGIHEMTYPITPPSRALMQLSEVLLSEGPLKEPVTVTKMELGYKLESDVFNSTIFSGELSLYWRFTIDGKSSIDVNALE